MDNLSKSKEDYLEAIYILAKATDSVKSVKIADLLSVSRPAVNRATTELAVLGMIEKSSYSSIKLTPDGLKLAEEVYSRHKLIKSILLYIGISDKTAEQDCCKIEHILSPETLACLQKIADKIN